MIQIPAIQALDHADGLCLLPLCHRVLVHILKEEPAQSHGGCPDVFRHDDLRPVHTVGHHIVDHGVQPHPGSVPQHVREFRGQILFRQDTAPDGIVDIIGASI